MMETILFYLFAALALVCAFLVVANPFSRNPVTSAMFLVLTIVWLAGLYVLLHAYFLAAVQILVYAGAVMVLFLFVIMLLDLKEEERRKLQRVRVGLSVVLVTAIAAVALRAISASSPGKGLEPMLEGDTHALGRALFSQPQFLLPFEVMSVLLLVAMVGVVLLSKKDLK
jgi:NADH-quinone oxidoreductase subunit J